ncbi:MAG TPA: hypothetical protein VJX10_05450, partial [Pseudonocardiaceae bacterium]|nr:hypothetical protein [Pseudonocardiaceae bacterium]
MTQFHTHLTVRRGPDFRDGKVSSSVGRQRMRFHLRIHGTGRRGPRLTAMAAAVVLAAAAFTTWGFTSGTSGAATGRAGVRLTAEHRLSPATIRARQHYFGLDNVDPRTGAVTRDQVILSWTGQAGFAAALRGHVVLLDSWVAHGPAGKGPSDAYVGTTPQELAALRPEMVFVGHNHFDHVGDLPAVIRGNPGITVIDSSEGCDNIEAVVTDVPFTCRAAFQTGPQLTANGQTAESPFGSVTELDHLIPGVDITAVRHPHSGPGTGETEIDAPENTLAEQQFPCHSTADCPAAYSGPTSGAISILYQFRVRHFALTWHNTSGQIADTPVPAVLARLAPTSVEVGSIVS